MIYQLLGPDKGIEYTCIYLCLSKPESAFLVEIKGCMVLLQLEKEQSDNADLCQDML